MCDFALILVEQRDSFAAREEHAFHFTCFETSVKGGKDVKNMKKRKFNSRNKNKRSKAMTKTRGVCGIELCPNVYGAATVLECMSPKRME